MRAFRFIAKFSWKEKLVFEDINVTIKNKESQI